MADPISPPTKLTKRRWLQFSLRTMLILTALISAWLAFVYIPAKRADRAAKALQEKGFQVCYDYQRVPGTSPFSYSFRVQQPGPEFLRKLFGDGLFQHAESINRNHAVVNADDLSPLESISTIRSVSLTTCQIGDEHLKHLAGMRNLEYLGLHEGLVTDQGLANLNHLTELRILVLSNNQVWFTFGCKLTLLSTFVTGRASSMTEEPIFLQQWSCRPDRKSPSIIS